MLDYDTFEFFQDLLVLALVVVPAYFLTRSVAIRMLMLGFSGLYLIYLIAPRLALFYLMFWFAVFALQYVARVGTDTKFGWVVMIVAISAALAPMVLWKVFAEWYIIGFNVRFNQLVSGVSPWFGTVDRIRDIILPIGLSYATFRAVDLLIKVRLEIVAPLGPLRMFSFGFFPPVQMVGPVIEYTEVEQGFAEPTPFRSSDTLSGALLIVIGLVKVFVIAFVLEASTGVFAIESTTGAWWEYWIELFLFGFYLYFNFSGFSDVAIGIARLFGFELKPNFNNPYLKTNPSAFWNSWHMSLTRFCQRNVFVPLGGMRKKTQYFAILATMMTIALWHDISLSLVLFGLYHGLGLVTHRSLSDRRPARPDRALVLTGAAVTLNYVYFVLSLPLLLLPFDDIGPFYTRLVP